MKSITFIHSADLHLDSPFKGLGNVLPASLVGRLKESSFISLHRIIDRAIDEKVDFVLFSGDIYDSESRSITAQVKFREEMQRLQAENIEVFITHGNHDYVAGDQSHLQLPSNVHLFEKEEVEIKTYHKHGEALANIYGFSYEHRAVTKNMTPYYKKRDDAPFHIGMLHGSVESDTAHDTYAPFTLHQLREKEFHYWALGHIHARNVLCERTPIIYSGNIQGRNRKESGDKGCYLVTMTEQKTTYDFIPTCDVIWKDIEVPIYEMTSVDDWFSRLSAVMEEERIEGKGVLLRVTFTGYGFVSPFLKDVYKVEESISALLEKEENQQDFVWIVQYEDDTTYYESRDALKEQKNFIGDLLEVVDQYEEVDETLRGFFGSSFARKMELTLSEEEKEDMMQEAERILLNELLKEGEPS